MSHYRKQMIKVSGNKENLSFNNMREGGACPLNWENIRDNNVWRTALTSVGQLKMFFIPKIADWLVQAQKKPKCKHQTKAYVSQALVLFVQTEINRPCTLNSDMLLIYWKTPQCISVTVSLNSYTGRGENWAKDMRETERKNHRGAIVGILLWQLSLSLSSRTSTLMRRSWLEWTTVCAWNTHTLTNTHTKTHTLGWHIAQGTVHWRQRAGSCLIPVPLLQTNSKHSSTPAALILILPLSLALLSFCASNPPF